MAENNTKTFVDTMVEAQKNVVDTMVENTRRFAGANPLMTETAEKGGEWYKQWLDNQQKAVSGTTETASNAAQTAQNAAGKTAEFYQNWYNQQMEWAKRFWDTTTGAMQNMTTGATQNMNNPAEAMQAGMTNMTQQWNTWMQNWNNWTTAQNWMNNMMSGMQNSNPFNTEAWKSAGQQWTGLFNQWYELLNNMGQQMQQGFGNGNTQDAYRNMLNSAEGFTRFAEMWQPMWKSIQEKTFNTELFRQMMNPAQYQELMDKYFGFMPQQARQYMQQMTTLMQDWMKQSGAAGMNWYGQMRQGMQQMMPAMNGSEAFGGAMNLYNNIHGMFQSAVSPIARMMTPNAATRTVSEWQDLMHRSVQFSIKNAELQYMTYQQGAKVMDRLAENITTKIQNGEEIKSLMSLYQEWLNLSDTTFVQLFESDTYSSLMAEVSALQLRLKKDVETQLEKAMANIPVATRTELDELYKTIYDLKKEVREMARERAEAPATQPTAAAAPETAEATAARTAANGRAGKK